MRPGGLFNSLSYLLQWEKHLKTPRFKKTHLKTAVMLLSVNSVRKGKTKSSLMKGLLWASPFSNDLQLRTLQGRYNLSFHPGGNWVSGRTLLRAIGWVTGLCLEPRPVSVKASLSNGHTAWGKGERLATKQISILTECLGGEREEHLFKPTFTELL